MKNILKKITAFLLTIVVITAVSLTEAEIAAVLSYDIGDSFYYYLFTVFVLFLVNMVVAWVIKRKLKNGSPKAKSISQALIAWTGLACVVFLFVFIRHNGPLPKRWQYVK